MEEKKTTLEEALKEARKICDQVNLELKGLIIINDRRSVTLFIEPHEIITFEMMTKIANFYGTTDIDYWFNEEECKVEMNIYVR